MAKSKSSQAAPAAGQQITKYYNRYPEDKGTTSIEDSTDGYTLYRAISRQVIGYPSRFLDVRKAVLQFYLRVYANKQHPLHDECTRQESILRQCKGEYQLFALLDSPDLDPRDEALWVIAYALRVRIDVYKTITPTGEPQDLIQSVGPQNRPVCAVVRKEVLRPAADKAGETAGMPYTFESLIPDEAGKALIEYLQAEKEAAAGDATKLQVKQISWAWDRAAGCETWSCFNEYRPESQESDLKYSNDRDRMDTFVVTVNESKHIGPALELFREALRRAPNQRRWTRHSNNKEAGFMLPHCSVDAEFVKMERDTAEDFRREGTMRYAVQEGDLEELCSVLTFAVSRHFFLLFNIVHMLETSDRLTVPALTTLFRQTIFDQGLLKLWWNPQNDMTVLNATIAHLFQQTPREPYTHCPHKTDHEIVIEPKWRIKRNHVQSKRPDDLKFPTETVDCELHRWGNNEQDMACCCRLGNIDIASLFGHFCRMHGVGSNVKKVPWTEIRPGVRYGELLQCMLDTDRLYPLLNWMKNRAGMTGKSRDAFYQDMGRPEMSQEDDVMAYNIGDVAGQTMMFEQLLVSDDKNLLAGCLDAFNRTNSAGSGQRQTPQRPSAFGTVGGIQLWVDNPRSFEDQEFETDPYNPMLPKAELYSSHSLLPWEHDRRVRLMREKPAIELRKEERHHSGAYVLPTEANWSAAPGKQRDVLVRMHDPTRLTVSKECVQRVDGIYEEPVVRAGMTHSEALLDLLRSAHIDTVKPPAGFGVAPGDSNGLPAWIGRIPGQDLDQVRNIFEAFEQHDKQAAKRLGECEAMPQSTGWLMEGLDPDRVFEEAWKAFEDNLSADGDQWTMAALAKYKAQQAVEMERLKTVEEGLPYSLDTHDFFDLEGREYQRRVESAESWNRPELQPTFTLNQDGTVKSLATMQLQVLNDKSRLPDVDGFQPVEKKLRRKYF